jgi:Flp pilus assembly protein protease CpaA
LPVASETVVVAVVAGCGALGAAIDLRSRRVPNWLTLGIAVAGLTLAATRLSGLSFGSALAGLALGLVVMLPGHVIGATGAGDVKLLAALGTMLGPKAVALAFVYAAIAGQRRTLDVTVARTAMLVRSRGANVAEIEQTSSDNRFAYAPAIAIGALVAALGF